MHEGEDRDGPDVLPEDGPTTGGAGLDARGYGRARYTPRPRHGLRRLGRFAVWMLGLGILGVIAGGVAIVALFAYASKDLPDYHGLANYTPATMTRLYASDGTLVAEYAKQRRIFTPLAEMPKKVVDAFISAEDKNFYRHPGVDATGIARALWTNIAHHGENRSLVGGSTITQQVVKNFLLTNEKSLKRKITEAILAFRITKTFSKDKILELYLNEIYLGHGAYGVTASAQTYFGKDLAELSTEEAAMLAAMPKAPAGYDPFKNPERAAVRRNYVIGRMLEDGYINQAEADRALATTIDLHEGEGHERVRATYFAEDVRRHLQETYGVDALYKGGLFVQTTLDSRLQPLADKALRKALRLYDRRHGWRGPLTHLELDGWTDALEAYLREKQPPIHDGERAAVVLGVDAKAADLGFLPAAKGDPAERGKLPLEQMRWASTKQTGVPKKPGDILKEGDVVIVEPVEKTEGEFALRQVPAVNGALVALEPSSGRVLAMSGGYSDRGIQFNRATQAQRQPGSAFKPFVYLTAMENGFTPATVVDDAPISLPQGPGLPMWTPKNYGDDFLGPITLRTGLEKSRNLVTVRLAQMLGIKRIADVAERFGIYDALKPVDRNYSMVLGAHETTLLRLLGAYAAVDNGGLRITPGMIERIDDAHGKTLFSREAECAACNMEDGGFKETGPPELADTRERILDPRVAYQVTHILEGVVQRGTAVSAKALGIPLAGKTGTTNESRDTWFVGFTPDLLVGVYVGFDHPESLGKKETGGRVALPAFMDFMRGALEFYPARPFDAPPGIQFADVDQHSGVPVLPWQPAMGGVIHEAFVTGGPIFKPKKPEVADAPKTDANGQVVTGSETAEGETPEAAAATPEPAPVVPQPSAADRYAQDYYKAYQRQRLDQYQQYLNQRDAAGQALQPPPQPNPGYGGQTLRPRGYGAPTPNAPAPASTGTGALY